MTLNTSNASGSPDPHASAHATIPLTLAFHLAGEYFSMIVLERAPTKLTLTGLATSFVRTRAVALELDGDLFAASACQQNLIAGHLDETLELDGQGRDGSELPFLECELVGSPATSLLRLLSGHGEQQVAYLTAPAASTAQHLVRCVAALALPSIWAMQPCHHDGARLTFTSTDGLALVSGEVEATVTR